MDEQVTLTKGELRNFMYENYNKGLADERERIIKLLEENAKDISDAYASGLFLVATKSLIALIKGENQ